MVNELGEKLKLMLDEINVVLRNMPVGGLLTLLLMMKN